MKHFKRKLSKVQFKAIQEFHFQTFDDFYNDAPPPKLCCIFGRFSAMPSLEMDVVGCQVPLVQYRLNAPRNNNKSPTLLCKCNLSQRVYFVGGSTSNLKGFRADILIASCTAVTARLLAPLPLVH